MIDGEIGLFAVKTLEKGAVIGYVERFEEELFSWKDYEALDKETKKMVDKFCASTKDGFWGPRDINYIPPVWHMNHSCNGNAGFDGNDNFVTIRRVGKDEELCFDYGLLITNPRFRLNCKCGSENCRGTITGNDWQNPEYRKRNMQIMSAGVKELIAQEKAAPPHPRPSPARGEGAP